MSHLTIPDEVFSRLKARAAALKVTVEELVVPMLNQLADSGSPLPAPTSSHEWQRQFDDWMQIVQARANRYPAGFLVDDSRDSMYADCGE